MYRVPQVKTSIYISYIVTKLYKESYILTSGTNLNNPTLYIVTQLYEGYVRLIVSVPFHRLRSWFLLLHFNFEVTIFLFIFGGL